MTGIKTNNGIMQMKIPQGMSTIAFIMQQKGITVNSMHNGIRNDNGWEHRNYTVSITGEDFVFVKKYNRGMAHAISDVTPDDIISAMIFDSDSVESCVDILDFVNQHGCSIEEKEDLKRVRQVYNDCNLASVQIRSMFTDDEMKLIREYIEEQGL